MLATDAPARMGGRSWRDLSAFEPNPYISNYVWLDRKLARERNWARVWSPTNLNYDFYDLSNIRSGWAERPSVVASNIIFERPRVSPGSWGGG